MQGRLSNVIGPYFCRFLVLLWVVLLGSPTAAQEVTVYVFWQEGCPYCSKAITAITEMAETDPELVVERIELGASTEGNTLFQTAIDTLGVKRPAVPLVVVGSMYQLGYAAGRSENGYLRMIEACRSERCPDIIAKLRLGEETSGKVQMDATPENDAETVALPFLGETSLSNLSLPVLTLVLAAIDGFNPCAMWVLALLIGMLLGVEDSRRMWTLGLVFLVATALMYFAVLSAWLNVVLWIGAVAWLRLAIGVLAIAAGLYYLREYWTNPEGICKVTGLDRKRSVTASFRRVVQEPSLLIASLSIGLLAVSVNLIELVCSAGVPAVYTQVLAMHELPSLAHYGYLLVYISVFLLDDILIFVIAMATLRSVAATWRFSRISHLIGGVVLLVLGAVMVLRPDLLG
ncbi:hypothetical protein [Ruegeria profundi]|uniref:hypothetical protein n=1 Tax=Ruegeria profundi TaxID=1685378 RepID=UPI001CD435F6|nr:hypothetical protein [Ruegeria profundi]MCA0927945.1 hypothetical protein [Ruegeria profundi]